MGIGAGRRGRLPSGLAPRLPRKLFLPVDLEFASRLRLEVITLVRTLAQSGSLAVGQQFEILSLILLVRQTFQGFTAFFSSL